MKPPLLILTAIMTLLSGCASNRFVSAEVPSIRLHDGIPGKLVRIVTDPNDLRLFVSILSRAEMRKDLDEDVQHALWHGRCFDIRSTDSSGGRWLYDENTDRIARLDVWSGRYVYTPLAKDRHKLHELMKLQIEPDAAENSNQSHDTRE